jgi:phage shock protein A
MQDRMNSAMASLSETVGEDVPTFEQIRDKIEMRYATAQGRAELSEGSVESKMLEIEKAARNSEAKSRLDEIRGQLGLPVAATGNAAELQASIAELKESAPEPAAAEPAAEADET